MKHIVLTDPISGQAIRPPETLERLRETSVAEAERLLSSPSVLVDTACPACAAGDAPEAFSKQGFTYRECADCGSVFVSPRPSPDALARYYRESSAGHMRVEYFTTDSAAARFEQVVRSRVEWIAQVTGRAGRSGGDFADIGTVYPGLFAEMRDLGRFDTLFSVDPHPDLSEKVKDAGARVGRPDPGCATAVTAFEQFEHAADPARLLEDVHETLADGGVLFLTTRTISGFDLQVLWGQTPYIFVPEHLNLLSIDGLERLLDRTGYDLIELSTPGQLDVEFVREAARQDPEITLPRFLESLFEREDQAAQEDLQAFLQKNRLSSHVRVVARKR